jgi:unsaturated rhamnogalacturonyl hydrolase
VRERCERAADVLCAYPFEVWHFGDSVGFEGLLAASELLEEPRYAAFVEGVVRGWTARAEPYRELDNTAPGRAMCMLLERTGDERLREALVGLATYLRSRRRYGDAFVTFERAPLRAPYDGSVLSHEEQKLLVDPGAGVYVDCLHFDPPFFARLGSIVGDPELVEEAARQALAYVELLQDPASGLFHHFVLERTGEAHGFGWSRGQGWALLGLIDVLEDLPESHPARERLHDSLTAVAGALAETQGPSGHWPAVIGQKCAEETSAALFVAAGFDRALEHGWIGAELAAVADRAWQAGSSALRPDGELAGVSAAVWSATRIGHYAAVPTGFQVPWGQGPLLLAACSRLTATAA